jgi:hypothetical protein
VRPLALFVLDGRGPPGLNERSAHQRDAAEQDRTGCTAGTAREWSQSSNPPAGHKAMAIAPGSSEPVARPDRRHSGHPGGDPATDLLFAASGNRRHGHPRAAPAGVPSPHGLLHGNGGSGASGAHDRRTRPLPHRGPYGPGGRRRPWPSRWTADRTPAGAGGRAARIRGRSARAGALRRLCDRVRSAGEMGHGRHDGAFWLRRLPARLAFPGAHLTTGARRSGIDRKTPA